jgi:hypothetical protein
MDTPIKDILVKTFKREFVAYGYNLTPEIESILSSKEMASIVLEIHSKAKGNKRSTLVFLLNIVIDFIQSKEFGSRNTRTNTREIEKAKKAAQTILDTFNSVKLGPLSDFLNSFTLKVYDMDETDLHLDYKRALNETTPHLEIIRLLKTFIETPTHRKSIAGSDGLSGARKASAIVKRYSSKSLKGKENSKRRCFVLSVNSKYSRQFEDQNVHLVSKITNIFFDFPDNLMTPNQVSEIVSKSKSGQK